MVSFVRVGQCFDVIHLESCDGSMSRLPSYLIFHIGCCLYSHMRRATSSPTTSHLIPEGELCGNPDLSAMHSLRLEQLITSHGQARSHRREKQQNKSGRPNRHTINTVKLSQQQQVASGVAALAILFQAGPSLAAADVATPFADVAGA